MATTPPPETQPTQPAQPEPAPSEMPPPAPDIDVPAPQPGGDPGTGTAQPIGFAASSRVGQQGDADLGSTATMTASTGGLAGTSR